jgi:hypothetical protein
LVFFLGFSGGKETTSFNVVSEKKGLSGGRALVLEDPFAARVSGPKSGLGRSLPLSRSISLESESDEVRTTAISLWGHLQDHSLIEAFAFLGSNASPLSAFEASSAENVIF